MATARLTRSDEEIEDSTRNNPIEHGTTKRRPEDNPEKDEDDEDKEDPKRGRARRISPSDSSSLSDTDQPEELRKMPETHEVQEVQETQLIDNLSDQITRLAKRNRGKAISDEEMADATQQRDMEYSRRQKLDDRLRQAHNRKLSTEEEIELIEQEKQKEKNRQKLLTLQIERAQLRQENALKEEELRNLLSLPANSTFFASRAHPRTVKPALPSQQKRTSTDRLDSSEEAMLNRARKKSGLKLKQPKEFTGEESDPAVFKQNLKRFKRDIRANLYKEEITDEREKIDYAEGFLGGRADRRWDKAKLGMSQPTLEELFNVIEQCRGDPHLIMLKAQQTWLEVRQGLYQTAREHWDALERIQSTLPLQDDNETDLKIRFVRTIRKPSIIPFTAHQVANMAESELIDYVEERDPTKNTSQQNRRDDKEGQPSYDHTRGGFRGEQRSGPSSRPMDLRPKSVENDRTLASDKVPNEEKDRRRQAGLCIKCGKGPHRMEECKTGWFYRGGDPRINKHQSTNIDSNPNLLPIREEQGKGRAQ